MKIILLRHGESMANVNKQVANDECNYLTVSGITDTIEYANEFKGTYGTKINKVYCSPLTRARQTCMTFLSAVDLSIDFNIAHDLKEKSDKTSLEDHYSTTTNEFISILTQCEPNDTILLVSHYFTMQCLMSYINHDSSDFAKSYNPRNSLPYVFDL